MIRRSDSGGLYRQAGFAMTHPHQKDLASECASSRAVDIGRFCLTIHFIREARKGPYVGPCIIGGRTGYRYELNFSVGGRRES